MTPEEREEWKREIREDIRIAVHENLGAYKIPKEQHYIDHEWIKGLREWQDTTTSTIWKTALAIIMSGVATLLVYGFILWGKKNIGGN